MGHKTRARDLAAQYGMPMSQGSEVLPDDNDVIIAAARKIGFPVLVKPAGRRRWHRHAAGEGRSRTVDCR